MGLHSQLCAFSHHIPLPAAKRYVWGLGGGSELEDRESSPRWLGASTVSLITWLCDPNVVSKAPKRRKVLCVNELGEIHEPVPTCKALCFGWRFGLPSGQAEGKEILLL